jgi:hypothetical protein
VEDLPTGKNGFDAVVSGLVLNFIPDPESAVASMVHRVRPEGFIGAYVWDYMNGMEMLRYFWDEAVIIDPLAKDFDEGNRFPLCQPDALASLFSHVGLHKVETQALEIQTNFADFNDYWKPFLGGTGPAPAFLASLDSERRNQLYNRLKLRIPAAADGTISIRARAWAVRGFVS